MDSCPGQEDTELEEGLKSEPPALLSILIWFSAIVLLGSYLCASIFSAAFFGHLTIGHWIVSHYRVPTTDIWTLAAQGRVWRSDAWLFEVMLSAVESMFGDKGLIVLKLLLFSAFVGAASCCFSARSGDRFFGTFVAFVVSCGVLLGVCLEAKLLGWIFFIICLDLGCRFESGEDKKRLLILIFFLGLLYSNVHSSSLGCLLVLAMLLLSEGENPIRRGCVPFLALFALAQIATPYLGTQVYSSLRGFLNFLSLELNYQANPATIFQYPVAFLLLLLIVIGYLWHCHPWTLRGSELLIILFAAIMGFASRSLLPYALMLCGLMCARLWGRVQGSGLGNLGIALAKLEHQFSKLPAVGLIWVILCLIIVNIANLVRHPITTVLLPAAEVDYLLEDELPFPLLHESAVGPYLQYRFADQAGNPKQLVAMTPAAAQIAPNFAVAEMFLKDLHPGWEKFFTLIAPQTVLCRIGTPLYESLVNNQDWELVFEAKKRVGSGEEETTPSRRSLVSWAVFRAKTGSESHT
jgi:hypothetical protein